MRHLVVEPVAALRAEVGETIRHDIEIGPVVVSGGGDGDEFIFLGHSPASAAGQNREEAEAEDEQDGKFFHFLYLTVGGEEILDLVAGLTKHGAARQVHDTEVVRCDPVEACPLDKQDVLLL